MLRIFFPFVIASIVGMSSASAHDKHCEDTDLGAAMSQMKKTNKKLKKAIRSEDFEKVVELSDKLKELGIKSAKLKPLKYKGEDQKFTELKNEYRDYYKQLSTILDNIELTAKQGSGDKLQALFSELNENKKKAHKAFKKDCD